MQKNTKIVVGILAVGVVIILIIGYMASARNAKQTAAATATVMSAERESSGKARKTLVTVSYQAGGAAAQGKVRVGRNQEDKFPAGSTLPICYDPADTASVRIADGPCG